MTKSLTIILNKENIKALKTIKTALVFVTQGLNKNKLNMMRQIGNKLTLLRHLREI